MRQQILTLGLLLGTRALFAQEAVNGTSVNGQTPAEAIVAPVSGNAWIDLRQNVKPGAVQSVPNWVEAVTFTPADTQTDPAARVSSEFAWRDRPIIPPFFFSASSSTTKPQLGPKSWRGMSPVRKFCALGPSAPGSILKAQNRS